MSDAKSTREEWLALFEDCLLGDEIEALREKLNGVLVRIQNDRIAAEHLLLSRIEQLTERFDGMDASAAQAAEFRKDLYALASKIEVGLEAVGWIWGHNWKTGRKEWLSRGMTAAEFEAAQEGIRAAVQRKTAALDAVGKQPSP
jgi:hypothetical protein